MQHAHTTVTHTFLDCVSKTGAIGTCREAFAAWLPPFGVPLSYAIAISYVLVDTYDKGQRAYKAAEQELGSRPSLHPEVNTGRYCPYRSSSSRCSSIALIL